ncbi:DUF3303 domain-containing protein [Prochlorococcus sp. AH-716-B20]|nr:DUF3303 domain-containing protein [Prochlorococcus sp. AH-716-B20]
MQLYVINWSFQNAEDQLFATKEFCEFMKANKLNQFIEGFELIFIAHTPQDGSGFIICKAQSTTTIFNILNMWRENFSISFDIKPALTSEALLSLDSSKDFWAKD